MKVVMETVKSLALWWGILFSLCVVLELIFQKGRLWHGDFFGFVLGAGACSVLLHVLVLVANSTGIPVIVVGDETKRKRK